MAGIVLLQPTHQQLLQREQVNRLCHSMQPALQRVEHMCPQPTTYDGACLVVFPPTWLSAWVLLVTVFAACVWLVAPAILLATVFAACVWIVTLQFYLPILTPPTASEGSSDLTGILVGSIVGGVVLIAGAALVGFAVWRRRRRKALPDLPALKDMAVVRQLQGSGAFLSAWGSRSCRRSIDVVHLCGLRISFSQSCLCGLVSTPCVVYVAHPLMHAYNVWVSACL